MGKKDTIEIKNGIIRQNGKYNIVNKKLEIISKQWFDYIKQFKGGFACVEINNKWNFINKNGEFLSKVWFDDISDFKNGAARVCRKYKWNYINKQGVLISEKWFNWVRNFNDKGVAAIKLGKKYNLINKDGGLLMSEWVDRINEISKSRFVVSKEDGNYILDDEYHLVNKEPYLYIEEADQNGYARVESMDNKWNFIDKKGNLLSEEWFDTVCSFIDGYASVSLDKRWNLIDEEGFLLSEQWFDDIYTFDKDGYCKVQINGYLDKDGNFFLDKPQK